MGDISVEAVRFVPLPIQRGDASARREGGWMDAVDAAPLFVGLGTWGVSHLPSCRK